MVIRAQTPVILVAGTSFAKGRLSSFSYEWLRKVAPQFPECLGRPIFINVGQGSATSTTILTNIQAIAHQRPTHAFIEPGDINNSVVTGGNPAVTRSQTTTDRAAMRAALIAANPGIKIVWVILNGPGASGTSLRPNYADFANDTKTEGLAFGDIVLDCFNGTVEFPDGYPKPMTTSLTRDNDDLHQTEAASRVYFRPQLELCTRRLLADFYGLPAPTTPVFATVTLSANAIVENAAENTIVGQLQNTDPNAVLTMTNTAGGRFKLTQTAGVWYVVAGATKTDYETATSHNITIQQKSGNVVNSPQNTNFTINVSDVALEGAQGKVRVTGGGGGGGDRHGGGGGAGATEEIDFTFLYGVTYSFTVGDKGYAVDEGDGTDGGTSTGFGLTKLGGGGGKGFVGNGRSGASGGGAGYSGTGGSGTAGQGNAGGNGNSAPGGGGGANGAGEPGRPSGANRSGNGGPGHTSTIWNNTLTSFGFGGPGGGNEPDGLAAGSYSNSQAGGGGFLGSGNGGVGGTQYDNGEGGFIGAGNTDGYEGSVIILIPASATYSTTGNLFQSLLVESNTKRMLYFRPGNGSITVNS